MDNGANNYRRFLDGNDEVLVDLIEPYKDGLILYLTKFTNDVFLAEDLMEDTFVRLAIKKPYYSGRSSFKTFLFAIARNIAVDYLRKESRIKKSPLDEAHLSLAEASLEQEYIQEEKRMAIHKALSRLNPTYAQVLFLIYFEGFSNNEAAKVMHKSKRQIEQLIYRAKASLRTELEKDGIEYEE